MELSRSVNKWIATETARGYANSNYKHEVFPWQKNVRFEIMVNSCMPHGTGWAAIITEKMNYQAHVEDITGSEVLADFSHSIVYTYEFNI